MSAEDDVDGRPGYAPFDLFPYNPSVAPAYAFVGLFGAAAILHVAFMIPYRSVFPLPMVIGCGMEAAGYYFRSRSHDNVRQTLPFVIQNLLVLAAPPLLAASIYMSPRRVARALGAEKLAFAAGWTSKLFVIVDVACLATQVAGSIMSGSEEADEAKRGQTIITVGLVLQIVAFGLFVVYVAAFQVRVRSGSAFAPLGSGLRWERVVYGLYVVSALFISRNATRLVEYGQGHDGEMLSNEVWLYVLDATVMFAIAVVLLVLHPGRLRMKLRRLPKTEPLEDQIPLS